MITYQTQESGAISGNGIDFIPIDHRLYTKALEEADSGEAEILPYVEEAISDHGQALIYINALESTVTNRRLREAALTDEGKAWLQNVDDDIAVLRASL